MFGLNRTLYGRERLSEIVVEWVVNAVVISRSRRACSTLSTTGPVGPGTLQRDIVFVRRAPGRRIARLNYTLRPRMRESVLGLRFERLKGKRNDNAPQSQAKTVCKTNVLFQSYRVARAREICFRETIIIRYGAIFVHVNVTATRVLKKKKVI